MPYERSAGAIIFYKRGREIEYLLLHYRINYWGLPKGHVEPGETDQQTAVREIKEETGLYDLEFISGFESKIYWSFKRKSDNQTIHKEAVFFLCRSRTKNVKLSFEHTNFMWLSFSRAIKKVSFDNIRVVLRKADNFLKKLNY